MFMQPGIPILPGYSTVDGMMADLTITRHLKTGLEDHILKDLLLAGTCLLIGGISVLLGMRKQKN